MKKPEVYVGYHIHSMLSNGTTNVDSITNFRDYVKAAKECGMPALGFSEHGNIFEWLHKKEAIEAAGIKYLHCVEAYLTEDNDNSTEKTRDNYHCILIAKNYDGVKELNKMVSKSFNRNDCHFYYMPRITFDELFATSDNVIVTTACLGGVLNRGTPEAKERYLNFLRQNLHRCFLEIQHHNCQDQIEYNRLLHDLGKELGIPLIAGTDTHALNDKHMDGRAMLQKSKAVHFADEDSWDLTFKTPEQLIKAFQKQKSLPMDVVYEAMNNTVVMADMVEEFKLDYNPKYPKLYEDSETVFKQKINEGVIRRGINKLPNRKEYIDRIHYEYDTYKHNGAIDFMLLEENYKSEMRKKGVRFGYSRGSVSGSVIAYVLGITEVDSVKYNLNFERFMNRERISLADVDTDWLSEDRKIVKDYLYEKQGLYCCDIVTFNTIALKGAIRDVCRGLYSDEMKNLPKQTKKKLEEYHKTNEKAGYYGPGGGSAPYMPKELKDEIDAHAKDYLKIADEIIDLAEVNEDVARRKYPEVFKYVDMVNGVVVSVGNHPAGCVVSPVPVEEWFGTFTTTTDEYPISLLNMKEIDSLNFVKLDILGLDNIGLIYKTCDAAGIPFLTPDNTPGNDLDVWNSISDDTTMIFQWESQSATAYLKQLFSESTIQKIREQNPNFSYMDLLSIGNGAIRPAGESYRDKLSQGIYQDNGHEALNKFLAPTLGYLVYQEEIIEFLHSFCGYTMGEADVVRRCVEENTMITLGNGKRKKIKDIDVGDQVLTSNEFGKIQYNTVLDKIYNGRCDVLKINTKHSHSIEVTGNHLMLTQRGWVRADELTIDDFLITPKKNNGFTDDLPPQKRLDCYDMFLIGMLIGDGTLSKKTDLHFTNSDINLIEEFKHCVNQRLKHNRNNCEFNLHWQDGITVDSIYSISIKSKNYRDSVWNLLQQYELNCKASEKHIHKKLMQYPCGEKLYSLLGGLFSTDGGYVLSSQSVEYYTISEELAYDVQFLLGKCSIFSYVYSGHVKTYDYQCYKVRINAIDALKIFYTTILPFIKGNKYDELKSVIEEKMAKSKGSVVTSFAYNYQMPSYFVNEMKTMAKAQNISLLSCGIKSGLAEKRGITDIKMREYINSIYAPETYKFLMSDYIPEKITGITPNGKKNVYDLSVETNHNFVANGLIVHNCFAKKLGTESHIPKIKAGFTKTMLEKYGVQPDESEKLIVNFIQVIEDASAYLFSKNHADPYSWIGYICGYLRYYYPLEFITSALNIFEGKEEKSLAIIEYAKKVGIKISPIKFRHSVAQYNFDKETNEIFKGISSIKFMNSIVADELYALRDNQYSGFIDLLYDIKEKTPTNSRQLKILIDLDFFSEFGDANYLTALTNLYDDFGGKKQIKKDKIESSGIDIELVRKFAAKETEKMFTGVDTHSMLRHIKPKYTKRSLKERVAAQVEHLGYIDIIDEKYAGVAVTLDVDTKYAPKLKMYSLKNGTIVDCKVDKRTFNKGRIKKGDLVKIQGQTKKLKLKRQEDGSFEPVPGVFDVWITKYTII